MGISAVGDLRIESGIFVLNSSLGAGIGGGRAYTLGNASVANVTLVNGIFDISTTSGAGIGSGHTMGNVSTILNLMIENGRFTFRGINSTGIGSGAGTFLNRSRIDSVKISGGKFDFKGAGGLDCRYCDSLIIGNSSLDCSGISSNFCLRAPNVTFRNGPFNIRTPQSNFVEFERAMFSGNPELWIEYLSTSVRENIIGLPIIHIEQLQFNFSSIYQLYISRSDEINYDCNRSFIINSSNIRGIAFSVPSLGNYSISYATLSPRQSGYLFHDSINTFAALFDNDTFHSKADLVQANDMQAVRRSIIQRRIHS
jgi:hypothetical protein